MRRYWDNGEKEEGMNRRILARGRRKEEKSRAEKTQNKEELEGSWRRERMYGMDRKRWAIMIGDNQVVPSGEWSRK